MEIKRLSKKKPTLDEAKEFVGGWVELVPLDNGDQLLCDEDGGLKRLKTNEEATDIVGQRIVGNVMILSGKARWD
jgi:hypothetical protein